MISCPFLSCMAHNVNCILFIFIKVLLLQKIVIIIFLIVDNSRILSVVGFVVRLDVLVSSSSAHGISDYIILFIFRFSCYTENQCSFQVNHGGVRGKVPRKFFENPDDYCNEDDDDDDEDNIVNNDVMEVEKPSQVSPIIMLL